MDRLRSVILAIHYLGLNTPLAIMSILDKFFYV
jgi:hypothetical protein